MVGKEACYNALTFRTKKAAGLSGSPEMNLTFFLGNLIYFSFVRAALYRSILLIPLLLDES